MSIYECSITNPKKQLEFYKDLSEQLQRENQQLKEQNKELEFIVGLRQKRNLIHKFDKEFDKEDKKKNPNRDYAGIMPDAEEVYKRYYNLKSTLEEIREYAQKLQNFNNKCVKLEISEDLLQIIDKSMEEK